MLAIFAALLGASVMHEASAQWGTGGAISVPRKGFETLKLYCDLSHADSTAVIDTTPANANPAARPSFKFSGQVVCAEIPASDLTPSLSDAITFKKAPFVKAVGKFNLVQVTDPTLFPGLNYSEATMDGQTTRTWIFDVTDQTNAFAYAQALWRLVPVDPVAQRFCDPAELLAPVDLAGVPTVLDPANCQALFGLKTLLPLVKGDYGNVLGLAEGQVFKFETLTKNDVESALGFDFAPCHTTRFIGPKTALVEALTHSSNISPGGVVNGTPFSVLNPGTTPLPYAPRDTLHVTVQPNDLWNAGALRRWSNANGLIENLFTTPSPPHKSYKSIDPVSGLDYLDQLDPEVAAWCALTNCPDGLVPDQIGDDWPDVPPLVGGFQADFGALVGRVNGVYHLLGTHATVMVPEGSSLELFYWDTFTSDNFGSVKVTVATDSIQCAVNGTPIAAQGDLRGYSSVQVVYNPTLNMKQKSASANFPTTIVGCSNYNPPFVIQPDGSPIIDGDTKVYVAGTEVVLKSFHVANTISRPACDSGQALPDLKLDLNRDSVIKAILASGGGDCTNGANSFKLEIGSDGNGWFAGTSTINLIHCP
jgi:hypothetical protein